MIKTKLKRLKRKYFSFLRKTEHQPPQKILLSSKWSNVTQKSSYFLPRFSLNQWSQTCGLREGPMRPANIRENEDFKGILSQVAYFFKNI